MLCLDRVVIVEGRYDKKALENIIDAIIITTDGFAIFKNKEKCKVIRTLAERDGIIVMTDSDSGGQVIRSYIKKICGEKGKITYVSVPRINGKEKRKKSAGKDGILGVEGIPPQLLLDALSRSGVTSHSDSVCKKSITKTDLFRLGLSGGSNSSLLREQICKRLSLPEKISANAFLDLLNALYSPEEFENEVILWRQDSDRK